MGAESLSFEPPTADNRTVSPIVLIVLHMICFIGGFCVAIPASSSTLSIGIFKKILDRITYSDGINQFCKNKRAQSINYCPDRIFQLLIGIIDRKYSYQRVEMVKISC